MPEIRGETPMNTIRTLTALTLTAVLIPAMALSTAAVAQSSEGMEAGSEHYMTSKPEGAMYGNEIIGQSVRHRGTDEEIGVISDLVIGSDGQIAGVVVTTGQFLGLGGQEIGLSWGQLEHTMEGDQSMFHVDMDEETLRNAPQLERW